MILGILLYQTPAGETEEDLIQIDMERHPTVRKILEADLDALRAEIANGSEQAEAWVDSSIEHLEEELATKPFFGSTITLVRERLQELDKLQLEIEMRKGKEGNSTKLMRRMEQANMGKRPGTIVSKLRSTTGQYTQRTTMTEFPIS